MLLRFKCMHFLSTLTPNKTNVLHLRAKLCGKGPACLMPKHILQIKDLCVTEVNAVRLRFYYPAAVVPNGLLMRPFPKQKSAV